MKPTTKQSSLLTVLADRIWVVSACKSKEDLLRQLTRAVCKAQPDLQEEEVLALIIQREKGMTTTLETGLSVPHARLEEIQQAIGALAILPQGLQFSDQQKIQAMLLFVSPARSEYFQKHLQLLAAIAQVFTPQCLSQLTRCKTVQQAQQILTSFEDAQERI